MLNIKVIAAMTPGKVTLETHRLDENALSPDHILLKTLYSAVSAGTECAWISGNANNPDQAFPFYPGYSAVGRVVKVGSDVKNFAVASGQDAYFRNFTASLALHGKLFIDEGDDRTHCDPRQEKDALNALRDAGIMVIEAETTVLSAEELRTLYRSSGVHIYSVSDDVFAVSESAMMLHASQEGEKTIILPAERYVTEIPSGKKLGHLKEIKKYMRLGETALYLLEPHKN